MVEGVAGGWGGVVHGPRGEDGVERRRLRRGEDDGRPRPETERKREGQQLRLVEPRNVNFIDAGRAGVPRKNQQSPRACLRLFEYILVL